MLAVVVARTPPSSAQIGDMALITSYGEFPGWLGGSCTRPPVEREAQRALSEGTPRLLRLAPNMPEERRSGLTTAEMTCASGGTVEIYLDPVVPVQMIRRFVDVDDCGNIINPMIVDGQIHGGLTMGMAPALLEEISYDDRGNIQGGSLMDYLVPTAMETSRSR